MPPSISKSPERLEPLDQQRRVDLLAGVVHLEHVLEQLAMRRRVEIVGPDDQRHVVAHPRIEQQAAEHALLGLQAVRRRAVEQFRRRPSRRIVATRRTDPIESTWRALLRETRLARPNSRASTEKRRPIAE